MMKAFKKAELAAIAAELESNGKYDASELGEEKAVLLLDYVHGLLDIRFNLRVDLDTLVIYTVTRKES
jgi:hypothetical protein